MNLHQRAFSLRLLLSLAFPLLWVACGTVPISGRKSLNLVPESQIIAQSAAQYTEYVRQMPHSDDPKQVERVRVVCQRVADAATSYLHKNNLNDLAQQMKWEFTVIADRRVNAFCMPGGKIVIYTGILPLCATDDELATVVSHEVSHAIARHSNERLSTEILRQMGGRVLVSAVGSTSAITNTVIQQAYGLGSQVLVSLPYSRKQEHEADQIGLVFMAMAGYNPEQAISFWKKMAQQGGGSTSELLSTHPSDANRIKAIGEYLPKALPYYQEYLAKQKVEQPKTPSTPAKDKKDTNRKPTNKKKSKKKSTKK